MKFGFWHPVVFCLAAAGAVAGMVAGTVAGADAAFAQAAERVAAHTDWSVFVANTPKECYIVSPPTKSAATRDGKPTEVTRGDIRLFVAFRPGENVSNEVTFNRQPCCHRTSYRARKSAYSQPWTQYSGSFVCRQAAVIRGPPEL